MEKLKQEPIWVCWRYEAVKGRRTKVLYSIKGRRTGTSKKYSGDWVSYNEAAPAKEKGSFDGIGFVIPAGSCMNRSFQSAKNHNAALCDHFCPILHISEYKNTGI